jgi:hypothetical protein
MIDILRHHPVGSTGLAGTVGYLLAVISLPETATEKLGKGLAALFTGAALLTAGWLFVRFGSGNAIRLASPDMRMHVDFETFW